MGELTNRELLLVGGWSARSQQTDNILCPTISWFFPQKASPSQLNTTYLFILINKFYYIYSLVLWDT
jgi:hypothetical protein